MATHPFEGFDRLLTQAAAILEAEGPPADWRSKGRSWYAQQIIVANDLMLAAIEAGDARRAAVWGIRLGGLIAEAEAPDLDPPRSRGGKARATATAKQRAAWRRQSAALQAQDPTLTGKSAIARAIDPQRWEHIRKFI